MGCYTIDEDDAVGRESDVTKSSLHQPNAPILRNTCSKIQTANTIHYVIPSTFFSEHNFSRNSHAVLFAACLLTFFRSSQVETEKIFALNVLLQTVILYFRLGELINCRSMSFSVCCMCCTMLSLWNARLRTRPVSRATDLSLLLL